MLELHEITIYKSRVAEPYSQGAESFSLFRENVCFRENFRFRENFCFVKVFGNKFVFSKLIKTFRGNTKTKIFVSTLPSNDMMQLRNTDCRIADYQNAGLEPHDMPNWSCMTTGDWSTGAT
jgi:hypothetical protein